MQNCKGRFSEENIDSSLVTAIQLFLLKIQTVAETLLFLTLASTFCHLVARRCCKVKGLEHRSYEEWMREL